MAYRQKAKSIFQYDKILICEIIHNHSHCFIQFILANISVSINAYKEIIFWAHFHLRTFIGVETANLTFRTKQYSTSYSSHICYGKRFFNDFFLNHHTIALVNNCLKLLSCVVIETAWTLTSSRTVLNAMIVMHVHRQL